MEDSTIWGRDQSPVRYRERLTKHTEDDIVSCEKKIAEVNALAASNQELLSVLEDTCLELDTIHRDYPYHDRPVILFWKKINWRECREIKSMLTRRTQLTILPNLNPEACLELAEDLLQQQGKLHRHLFAIQDLYHKFFFTNGEINFYPYKVNVSFPFPLENETRVSIFKVQMFHPFCEKRINGEGPIYNAIKLLADMLDFVTKLVSTKVTMWQAPKSTISTLMGPLYKSGRFTVNKCIWLSSHGVKWVQGSYYDGSGEDIVRHDDGTFFKLPLSLEPDSISETGPDFNDCVRVYPIVKLRSNDGK